MSNIETSNQHLEQAGSEISKVLPSGLDVTDGVNIAECSTTTSGYQRLQKAGSALIKASCSTIGVGVNLAEFGLEVVKTGLGDSNNKPDSNVKTLIGGACIVSLLSPKAYSVLATVASYPITAVIGYTIGRALYNMYTDTDTNASQNINNALSGAVQVANALSDCGIELYHASKNAIKAGASCIFNKFSNHNSGEETNNEVNIDWDEDSAQDDAISSVGDEVNIIEEEHDGHDDLSNASFEANEVPFLGDTISEHNADTPDF